MHGIDRVTIAAINVLVGHSKMGDAVVLAVQNTQILTVELLVAAYWWLWFRAESVERTQRTREALASAVIGLVVALGLSFALAPMLPQGGRPIHEVGLMARLPFGMSPGVVRAHQSFPSHHALLSFALVAGLFVAAPVTGALAALYAVVMIGMPPLYLGLHYPSDLLGGAIWGALVVTIFELPQLRGRLARPLVAFAADRPAAFYALGFLVTLQTATLFADIDPFLGVVASTATGLLAKLGG